MISSPSRRLLALLLAGVLACAGDIGHAFADAVSDFHAATRAVDAKDYDKAVKLYTRSLDSGELTEKQRYVTYAGRAFAHYFDRQYDRSLVDFDEAIRLAPNVAEYYAGRGAVYFDTGQHRKALDDYEEAVRLKPGYTKAVVARDALRKMLGEKDGGPGRETATKSARNKQAARRPAPASEPGADRSRSPVRPDEVVAVRSGEVHPAEVHSGEVHPAEVHPAEVHPAEMFRRGVALLSAGHFDDAIAAFDQVIRLAPRSAPAYAARSDAHNGNRQWDRAMVDAERAFALDPGNDEARRHMAIALNGKAWRLATSPDPAKRDGGRAVDLAAKAVRLYPEEPYIRGTMAASYAEAGRFDEAVSAQRQAIQMLIGEGRRREAAVFSSRLESYLQKKPHSQ